MAEHKFTAGVTIFRKGDPGNFAYRIESGEVEVLAEQDGRETRIALLRTDDILGEMAMVEERPHSMTARAVSDVRASSVTRDAFVDLILLRPRESLRYLRALFERLRTMNNRESGESPVAGIPVVENHGAREEPQGQAPAAMSMEVTLVPLTEQACGTLPDEAAGGLLLPRSPYRVGRAPDPGETALDTNDLALPDVRPYNISRNHFSIAVHGEGVFIHDRGSYLGTIVNGEEIGGDHVAGSALLRIGENEVIAGAENSPFRFRVVVRAVH
jgi:CRP-like cAMP-binding protein